MQHVGRMGALTGFALQICAGGAALIAPDEKWIGWTLASFGGLVFIVTLIWWLHANWAPFKSGRKRLEPTHIIILGLVIAACGVLWQLWRSPPSVNSTQTPINVIVQAPSATSPGPPAGLQANTLPVPPNTNAEKVVRYLQLKSLVTEAKNLKDLISRSSETYEKMSQLLATRKDGPFGSISTERTGAYENWTNSVRQLKQINSDAYKNRPMDMETVPELGNPLLKAPGEEAFGDNAQGAYKFRTFHYLSVNVQKQANALIEELERDFNNISHSIRDTPFAKLESQK
jgi:hypothetical protein